MRFNWTRPLMLSTAMLSAAGVGGQGVPLDLGGRYFAGSASGSTPGMGWATTIPGGLDGQVVERSGGAAFAPEAHLTPFSDTLKSPSPFMGSFAGRSLFAQLDLGEPARWQPADAVLGLAVQGDFFVAGLGGRIANDDANAEVWVAATRDLLTGEFAVELQTDGAASGPRYVAPGSSRQSRFLLEVRFASDGAYADLRVTPLNGSGSGVEIDVGTLALDLVFDDLTDVGAVSGFFSLNPSSVALATVDAIRATTPDNALYLHCDNPCARVGDPLAFRVGMANLDRGMFGFQGFLEAVGAPLPFASGAYTASPFPNWIVDPITASLDLASGTCPGDPPTRADATLAELRFDAAAEGIAALRFRGNNPTSQLADGDGSRFTTSLLDSNSVIVDSTPPAVAIVGAFQGANDILAGAEARPGPVEIRIRAVDGGSVYSGLAAPPTVRIVYPGSFGTDVVPASPGEDDTFVANASLSGLSPCGPATIEVVATDDAGNAATQSAMFDASPLATVVPTSYTVPQGVQESGNLRSLFEADADRIVIAQRYPVALTIPNARLVVEGTAPVDNPTSIRFQFKGSANAFPPGAFTQRIEMFDWVFNAWRIVDQRVPSNTDVTINVEFFGIAGNLINDATRQMLARMSLFDRGSLSPNYVFRIDRAIWRICR